VRPGLRCFFILFENLFSQERCSCLGGWAYLRYIGQEPIPELGLQGLLDPRTLGSHGSKS